MKKPNHYRLDLQLFAEGDPQPGDPEKVDPEKNYAQTIKELKANTVSRKDYEKLEEQNKQLLDAIINGNGDPDDKDKAEEMQKYFRQDLRYCKQITKNVYAGRGTMIRLKEQVSRLLSPLL